MNQFLLLGTLILLVFLFSEYESKKEQRMEKRKRPCEFRNPNKPGEYIKGMFHQFGTSNTIGRPAETVAIIEDQNGQVWKVDPGHVKFTDK